MKKMMTLAAGLLLVAGAAHAQTGTPSDPGAYSRAGTGNVLTDHLAGLPTNFPGSRAAWTEQPSFLQRAYADYSSGRFLDAVTRLQGMVSKTPNSLPAHQMLADIYIQQNRIKDAIPEMEQIVRLDPKDAAARDNLGVAYLQTAQYERAAVYYQDAATSAPKDSKPVFQLGLALEQGSKHAEAAQAFAQASALAPKDARAPLYAGLLFHQIGHDNKAVPFLQKALTLGVRQKFSVYTALAEADVTAKKTGEAIENYKLAAQADPKNALSEYNLGTLYEQQGRSDMAMAAYKKACALDPKLTDAADSLTRLGE